MEKGKDKGLLKSRFVEWCKNKEVMMFIFDQDDTLHPTRPTFTHFMSQAFDFLETNAPILTREEWKKEVETTNNRLFEERGVNPNRWDYVMDELAEKYSLANQVIQESKRIFQLIYTTPITFFPGTEEGLKFIKEAEIPIGIVTHASAEWTRKKFDWLGLNRFVNWKNIFIVNENGHKTATEWEQAIRYFGLKPGNCAVVGDSPRSDINPALGVGVKHCFLVEDPDLWSVHNQPVDPSVKRIKNISEIPYVVLNGI